MITREEYEQAIETKEAAEDTIREYLAQEKTNFDQKWADVVARRSFFTLDEIRFSAGSRCDSCGLGLAYPKGCGIHGRWDCSGWLLGQHHEPHQSYPFAFYSIISEDQKERAQGQTTRPTPESEGGAK